MKINEQTLKQFSKNDLIKCLIRVSMHYTCDYFVSHEMDKIVQENEKAKLSPLESASEEAETNLRYFEKSMCRKYGRNTFKGTIPCLNLDERVEYIKLVETHTQCLDKEMKEMDEQEKRWRNRKEN